MSTTIEHARERYDSDGYLIVPGPILPADVVSRAVDGMDAIRRGEYDTGVPPCPSPWKPGDDLNKLCKIEQPQFASRAIFELVSHPELGRWAAAITGASMVQAWWVQLLYKPPQVGAASTTVGWHQDRSYWGIWEDGSEVFTAWVAVSDVGADSGPMSFVRRSHRWGLRNQGDFYGQDLLAQKRAISLPPGAIWEEDTAILPPGGVSFHNCLTVHGSGPNISSTPRRSFAIHLRTQNSRPVGDRREGLSQYVDDPTLCPILFGAGAKAIIW